MKTIKISPQVCFMSVVFIAIHIIYVQGVIPPQVGWWNYYAWRLNNGDVLYKDIFCFLPPYFIYIITSLYNIFGSFLLGYQLFGLVLRFLEMCAVYSIINSFTSKNISFLASFAGMVLEISYLMNMPFDANQLLRFYIIMSAFFCMKALEQKKELLINVYLILSGIWLGIGMFSKQTCIVIIFFAFLGIGLFYLSEKGIIYTLKREVFFILGIAIACIPGILILIIQKSFSNFIYCITVSMSVKGGAEGVLERLFHYQTHFVEILIAVFVIILLFGQDQYRKHYKRKTFTKLTRVMAREIYLIILFFLILYRICQIIDIETGNMVSYKVIIIGTISYILIRLIMAFLKEAILKVPQEILAMMKKLTPIIICVVLFLIIIIVYKLDYSWKSKVYYQLSLFSLKRGLVNVIFWVMFLVLICQIIQFIMKRKIYGGFRCFVLNAFGMCLLGVGMISSVVEELYIFPIAALFFALLFNAVLNYTTIENEETINNVPYKVLVGSPIVGIVLLVIAITVIQKQVNLYQWHGWTCVGLGRNDVRYVYSDIAGLEGYVLDVETEDVYKTIVELIEENTNEDDIVYEFPHIALFNVLTERSMGTYSPVHYFDVCPDEIAVKDADYLDSNPPRMVIWCEFGEDLWNFHEAYYRNGKESGQREIRDFYWNVVQQNYTKLYEYQSISVWLRE